MNPRSLPVALIMTLAACGSSTPIDAGVDAPSDATDAEAFCDFPAVYTYGLDGGLVAQRESVTVAPGRRFTLTRSGVPGVDAGPATLSCTTTLDGCGADDGGAVGVRTVLVALNDADVMAAFSDQANTLYGRDPRPVDGQVFAVARGDGRHVETGDDCGGASGCRVIPAGLSQLRAALTDLQAQQRARPECAALRP